MEVTRNHPRSSDLSLFESSGQDEFTDSSDMAAAVGQPPSTLARLVTPLLSSIAQYLPLCGHLVLLRLSRDFPRLPPAAFDYAHIVLPADIDRWIRQATSGACPLLPMLSHASRISLRVKDWARWPVRSTPFDEPSPFLLFPRLQELYLAVDSVAVAENLRTLMNALVHSSPHLRSLNLHAYGPRSIKPETFQSLESLNYLTAVNLRAMFLHPSTFSFLCSLPLTYLDLSGAQNLRFDVDGVGGSSWLEEVPRVTRTWCTLLLPQDETTGSELYEAIFRLYRCEGLQFLSPRGCPTAHHLQSVAAITSLTALDLSGYYNMQELSSDISPLYDSDVAPCLPHLRHLHSIDWRRLNMSTTIDRAAYLLGCQRLVQAYGRQLHTLRITVPCEERERGEWLWHVMSYCTQLRLLHLSLTPCGEPHLTPTLMWPTAASRSRGVLLVHEHLHTLHLERCSWAELQLGAFASRCPVLQDCRLTNVQNLTLDVIARIGHLSPCLRRLSIESSRTCEDSISSSSSSLAWSAPSSLPIIDCVFPELCFLSVAGLSASLRGEGAFGVLVDWLQRAPHFRLFIAHSSISVREVLTLAGIPHLSGIHTSWCTWQLGCGLYLNPMKQFFKPYAGWSTVKMLEQRWRRWDEPESDEYSEDGLAIPRFVEKVDERSGREAFFDWLSSLSPGWEEEQRAQRREANLFTSWDR